MIIKSFKEFISESRETDYSRSRFPILPPSKEERSNPFMSTNIIGRDNEEKFVVKYWSGLFDFDMAKKLINVLTDINSDSVEYVTYPSDYVKAIKLDGEIIAHIENYGKEFSIKTKYVSNYDVLMKDVFPLEYEKHLSSI